MQWFLVWILMVRGVAAGRLRKSPETDPFCQCFGVPGESYDIACENLKGPSSAKMIRDLLRGCYYTPHGIPGQVTLYDSNLDSLPDDVFLRSPVSAFSCHACTLSEFPPRCFFSFGNATRRIAMHNCSIAVINATASWHLPFARSLTNLTFAFGHLPPIPAFAFAGFSRGAENAALSLHVHAVEHLTLNDYAFARIANVYRIALRDNGNLEVPLHAFWDLTSLRVLSLPNNGIKTIKNGTFSNLTRLTSLHLAGNPWRCTCNLQWLSNFIKVNRHMDYGQDPVRCDERNVYFVQTDFCSDFPGYIGALYSMRDTISDVRLFMFLYLALIYVVLVSSWYGHVEFRDLIPIAVAYLFLLLLYFVVRPYDLGLDDDD